jgi:site-specific recombinase XerD
MTEMLYGILSRRFSHEHYMDTLYHSRRWMKKWSGLSCSEITIELITELRDERSQISNETANKELRHLRSLFNWETKKGYLSENPAPRVDMMRVEKKEVYVPALADIQKILAVATQGQQDYKLPPRYFRSF